VKGGAVVKRIGEETLEGFAKFKQRDWKQGGGERGLVQDGVNEKTRGKRVSGMSLRTSCRKAEKSENYGTASAEA